MGTVLITGGSGLLGSSVAELASKKFKTYATYCKHRVGLENCEFVQVDLTDARQVVRLLEKLTPDALIHAAAMVNVDYCETHKEEAWKANVEATQNVAGLCEKIRARLIYVSTDYVFDGERGLYSETDQPNPLNYYAKTKLEGERVLEQHGRLDYCIARTCIYGWNVQESKPNFASSVLTKLRNGEKIRAFTDQYNSPMLANDCAEALLALADRDARGIFHVAGRERASKFDFARTLCEIFGLNPELIVPASFSAAVPGALAVRRPRDVSLDVRKKSEKYLGMRFPSLKEGLARMKELEETGYLDAFRRD